MKTRKSNSLKGPQQPARPAQNEISAPRHRSTWEPIPLQIPVPEIPDRPRERSIEGAQPSRGVVIIQYGDES